MTAYEQLMQRLRSEPKTWLVTGAAGFIGSNLSEALLTLNQRVIGLDNFSTGSRENLEEVRGRVKPEQWRKFLLLEGDTREPASCEKGTRQVDYVLHQAALGSVSRSLADPLSSHACNVTGFVNILLAARNNGVRRFVFASSSSVYGDEPHLPKREQRLGHCLSPYAATKLVNELYADVFNRCYGLDSIGLRYFNVFGPRQDPEGPYAAVIPKWIAALIHDEPVYINGDGHTSRDFCYVANVVQANLLAATTTNPQALNQRYNVAVNGRTSLNQLFEMLVEMLMPWCPHLRRCQPQYRDFRKGDVRHSQADISRARRLLGYRPSHTLKEGLLEALDWYRQSLVSTKARAPSPRVLAAPAAPG